MRRRLAGLIATLLSLAIVAPAAAHVQDPVPEGASPVQSAVEALAQDGAEYARANDVTLDEAMRRLRAQEESVAETDRLRLVYRDRLAGIAIEDRPAYRIVVLLTGSEPVPDEPISAGGMAVPIVFRTGAGATIDQIAAAMEQHRAEIAAMLPNPSGMGIDQRTGELVVMARGADADLYAPGELAAKLAALTGVPVRIRILDRPDRNLAVDGGGRVEGIEQTNGKRYACTTGFVVTDGARSGVVTAAHCPYSLTYSAPDGTHVPLAYVGAWGARYQDVQVQASSDALRPLFYVDRAKTVLRGLTSWRNRASMRAGDFVCHRGEHTGYSCAEVELVDYAPPGTLCGGPCDPTWVTVAGPTCKGGDSGGPVFSETIAFGIVKGGSYRRDGSCSFYFYMSTDYLPPGWTLMHEAPRMAPPPATLLAPSPPDVARE